MARHRRRRSLKDWEAKIEPFSYSLLPASKTAFGAQHDAGSEVSRCGGGDKDRGDSGFSWKLFLTRSFGESILYILQSHIKVLHSFRIVCSSTAAHGNERGGA